MNLFQFDFVLFADPKKGGKMTGAELNSILSEYGDDISRFCYSLCKNEFDTNDLFQETCIRLLKSDFTKNSGEETKSFLCKTCLNTFRDIYRKMRKRSENEIYGLSSEYLENIPEKVADDETYEYLYKAINKLPYKYRVVITMSYFDGLTEKNVSDILGIPPGTVKSRLYKAKQLLKKELEKNENFRI